MRVLMLVRDNLHTHTGGDTTQIDRTAAALRRLGVEIDLSSSAPENLASYDVVHLWHLDRLWENLAHARIISHAKIPAVLSTIYWPPDEYDHHARPGFQGWLACTLGSRRYENLRIAQRWAMSVYSSRRWSPPTLRFGRAVRELLDRVSVILPNSRVEQREIERIFGRRAECLVVPNAVDIGQFSPPTNNPPRQGVLCVGRIEPRKNQLALIRALSGSEIPLTLVGQTGRYNRQYGRQCRREAGRNVRFIDQQKPAQLNALYGQAKVHACVSWYETPGLASLEAAWCGCQVVVTPGGCTEEYFEQQAWYAKPDDPATIRDCVERALAADESDELRRRIGERYTWDRVGQQTLEAYRAAVT